MTLKAMMKKSGMTQEEIAEKVGTKRCYVALWSATKLPPPESLYEPLAVTLGYSVEDIKKACNEQFKYRARCLPVLETY